MQWETVANFTERMQVPGGWLYKYERGMGERGGYVTMTFVPEPVEEDVEAIIEEYQQTEQKR